VERPRRGRGEARRTRRVTVQFNAEYAGEKAEASGVVRNISLGGALIESPTSPGTQGSEVRIRFAFFADAVPIEVRALVVRETENGFAVRFVGLNGRIRALLGFALARIGRDAEPRDPADALLRRPRE